MIVAYKCIFFNLTVSHADQFSGFGKIRFLLVGTRSGSGTDFTHDKTLSFVNWRIVSFTAVKLLFKLFVWWIRWC
jgi:hypothetical protein